MNWVPALAMFGLSIFAQFNPSATPPQVERFCGKLKWNQRNLRHVVVNLYPAAENGQCCEGATAIATGVTGHWGSFNLNTKHLPGGLYWLEVQPEGKKLSMLIQYKPKKYPDQLCTETYWGDDGSGHLGVGGLITVD
jgi:hypothetical protein